MDRRATDYFLDERMLKLHNYDNALSIKGRYIEALSQILIAFSITPQSYEK